MTSKILEKKPQTEYDDSTSNQEDGRASLLGAKNSAGISLSNLKGKLAI